ncbi:hypothetical protein JHW43_000662 [Diplocarpon mali]|nr:hypothetical protein JHW43_000662 [Diplocarpon mali]
MPKRVRCFMKRVLKRVPDDAESSVRPASSKSVAAAAAASSPGPDAAPAPPQTPQPSGPSYLPADFYQQHTTPFALAVLESLRCAHRLDRAQVIEAFVKYLRQLDFSDAGLDPDTFVQASHAYLTTGRKTDQAIVVCVRESACPPCGWRGEPETEPAFRVAPAEAELIRLWRRDRAAAACVCGGREAEQVAGMTAVEREHHALRKEEIAEAPGAQPEGEEKPAREAGEGGAMARAEAEEAARAASAGGRAAEPRPRAGGARVPGDETPPPTPPRSGSSSPTAAPRRDRGTPVPCPAAGRRGGPPARDEAPPSPRPPLVPTRPLPSGAGPARGGGGGGCRCRASEEAGEDPSGRWGESTAGAAAGPPRRKERRVVALRTRTVRRAGVGG